MSAEHGQESRDVIPRWRPFGAAVQSGELSSHEVSEQIPHLDDGPEIRESFRADPGVYTAGELVSHAIATGQVDEDVTAAIELVGHSEDASRNSEGVG